MTGGVERDVRAFTDAGAHHALTFRGRRTISSEPPGAARTRPAETLLRFEPNRPNTDVEFHNGWIASAVPVQLLFWGGWWKTDPEGSQRRTDFTGAVQQLLASPFLWELDQYRAAPATYRGATIVDQPEPPANFVYTDATDLVWELIDDDKFPEPDDDGGRIGYFVILPRDTTHDAHGGAHAHALHENFLDNDQPAWYAWIGYGTLDELTARFSHELVEMMVSPELDGWHIDHVDRDSSEIGDICDASSGWVNGVRVQAYWSRCKQKCVIPTDGRVVRIDGAIDAAAPRIVASDWYTPPAPAGVEELLPACHLEGKRYAWTLSEIDETAELQAQADGFVDPAFSWTVAGGAVHDGSNRVSLTTLVSRPAAGGVTTASETVNVAYELRGTRLWLTNDSVAGNFEVPVGVSVHDGAGATVSENSPQASVVVPFQGAILAMPDYDADIARCQQAADELWKQTHKGTKHGPLGPLGERDRELLAGLPGWFSPERVRRMKVALLQAQAITEVDAKAGNALREVLVRGLHVDG